MNTQNIKTMTLEQLSEAHEKLRREFQSSKDKAVKDTNQRLDEMQSAIDGLRLELSDLRDMLKDYLTNGN